MPGGWRAEDLADWVLLDGPDELPEALRHGFCPPFTPLGRPLRRGKGGRTYQEALHKVATGETVWTTREGLFHAYRHPGVVHRPLSGLPPRPTAPSSGVRTPKAPRFARSRHWPNRCPDQGFTSSSLTLDCLWPTAAVSVPASGTSEGGTWGPWKKPATRSTGLRGVSPASARTSCGVDQRQIVCPPHRFSTRRHLLHACSTSARRLLDTGRHDRHGQVTRPQ